MPDQSISSTNDAMNLGPFQDIEHDDNGAFDDFKMSLQINHDRIAQKMYAAGLFYKTYPLIDSVAYNQDWQQNLQQELGSIYALLELNGLPDLSGADLDRAEEFNDFMQQLVFVERRINAFLGIL